MIFCPLVAELLDPSMRPRHWTALVNLCRALERCDSGGGKGAKVETCWTLIYFYYVIWDDLGWFGLIFFGEQDMSIDLGRFFWAGMVIICNNEATSCMWNGMTRCSRMGLCDVLQHMSDIFKPSYGPIRCQRMFLKWGKSVDVTKIRELLLRDMWTLELYKHPQAHDRLQPRWVLQYQ